MSSPEVAHIITAPIYNTFGDGDVSYMTTLDFFVIVIDNKTDTK